jgi:DNA-binding MarR family transcriptional regulator
MKKSTTTYNQTGEFQPKNDFLGIALGSASAEKEARSTMDHTTHSNVSQSRLRTLAEFRFQMRKFLSFSEIASERAGIAAQQYQLMQVIAAMPEGQQASIGYLAERMILRHNSMVELVDRAERAGLVSREHDEKDLRRSLVLLTPHGEEILRRLVEEHLKELAPRCESLMDALKELKLAGDPPPS